MNGDKKIIYFLVALIILLAIILLVKIKTMPQYDSKIYAEIYEEYENIFGKENDLHKVHETVIQNSIYNNVITMDDTYTIVSRQENSNIENSKVIGKIIIPKIEIRYPIIRETTTEYLKVAPTKYCGPDINEIRKFSYSRS